MIFNNVTCAVRNWCDDAAKRYDREAPPLYTKMHFAREMEYKAATLIDREFGGFEEYLVALRELVPGRISYVLVREKDPEALALVAEAEREFLAFLDTLRADVAVEPEPYYRVIMGDERDSVAYAILEKWDYSAAYWYPLIGGFDDSKLYLDVDILEPYMERLLGLLGLPEKRVYEYGESWFIGEHCAEVDDLYGYCGNEAAYLPKDLSWIIYFSHEGTVTFGGTIVPAVRGLLKDEKEYWNQY